VKTAKLEKVLVVKRILAELCQDKDLTQLERVGFNHAYMKIEEIQIKIEEGINAQDRQHIEQVD
jgi:hypothetical protein